VDADEDVELERASSRGKKKRTLAQAQAEEAPAPAEGGREREKCRIREDFEVAAQRLQDVTNAFGTTRASRPPLDTNVFGICLPITLCGNHFTDSPQNKTANERQQTLIRTCLVRTHIQLDSPATVNT
jgi:hypothetical protein